MEKDKIKKEYVVFYMLIEGMFTRLRLDLFNVIKNNLVLICILFCISLISQSEFPEYKNIIGPCFSMAVLSLSIVAVINSIKLNKTINIHRDVSISLLSVITKQGITKFLDNISIDDINEEVLDIIMDTFDTNVNTNGKLKINIKK